VCGSLICPSTFLSLCSPPPLPPQLPLQSATPHRFFFFFFFFFFCLSLSLPLPYLFPTPSSCPPPQPWMENCVAAALATHRRLRPGPVSQLNVHGYDGGLGPTGAPAAGAQSGKPWGSSQGPTGVPAEGPAVPGEALRIPQGPLGVQQGVTCVPGEAPGVPGEALGIPRQEQGGLGRGRGEGDGNGGVGV